MTSLMKVKYVPKRISLILFYFKSKIRPNIANLFIIRAGAMEKKVKLMGRAKLPKRD
jgi:hypothetical protein